jgi:hypothetical protein
MWRGLDYQYSKTVLKAIATYYGQDTIYSVLDRIIACDPCSVVEYKADFDMALCAIGRGKWCGVVEKMFCYRTGVGVRVDWKLLYQYGYYQQLVLSDVLGIEETELEQKKFDRVPQMKGAAYARMVNWLNTGKVLRDYKMSKTNYEAKSIDTVCNNKSVRDNVWQRPARLGYTLGGHYGGSDNPSTDNTIRVLEL